MIGNDNYYWEMKLVGGGCRAILCAITVLCYSSDFSTYNVANEFANRYPGNKSFRWMRWRSLS